MASRIHLIGRFVHVDPEPVPGHQAVEAPDLPHPPAPRLWVSEIHVVDRILGPNVPPHGLPILPQHPHSLLLPPLKGRVAAGRLPRAHARVKDGDKLVPLRLDSPHKVGQATKVLLVQGEVEPPGGAGKEAAYTCP